MFLKIIINIERDGFEKIFYPIVLFMIYTDGVFFFILVYFKRKSHLTRFEPMSICVYIFNFISGLFIISKRKTTHATSDAFLFV